MIIVANSFIWVRQSGAAEAVSEGIRVGLVFKWCAEACDAVRDVVLSVETVIFRFIAVLAAEVAVGVVCGGVGNCGGRGNEDELVTHE